MARGGKQDGLKRVSQADRRRIALSSTLNRFWRRREELRAQARVGAGCCQHCGSEPCAGGWGPLLSDQSARCCERCTHGEVEAWVPSHVLWHDKKAFFVLEVPVGKAGSVYLRQDGVAWFMRIGSHHYFLGRRLGTAEFARFKVTDRNGWPSGLKANDMGIDIDSEALDRAREQFEEDYEPEDDSEVLDEAGDELDEDDDGEELDEDEDEDEDEAEDGEELDADDSEDGEDGEELDEDDEDDEDEDEEAEDDDG